MKKIKIRDKECNCSNKIYWHIKGLESENRLFSMEIKGHEDCEYELQARINKAIELLGQYRHYCVPDENANKENEELVDKAYEILKGDSNE